MKLFSFILIMFSFLIFAGSVFALDCTQLPDKETIPCKFGTISPPSFIQQFIGADDTGASGISKFLSNLIVLIYSIAAIVLIFMILWGALEWMLSGGDKEKVASARGRIMNAFIGIILFAIAFAVIAVLGKFTGFTFFKGQNDIQPAVIIQRVPGGIGYGAYIICSNDRKITGNNLTDADCNK